MDMPDVGEKIGPLPIWAWALVGGGVILVAAKLGHSSGGASTVAGGLGGGTPIINGVDPQQAAADKAKAVADAIAGQQGADQTILDQVKASMQTAYDAFKAQADQAYADLSAADAKRLSDTQAADNANLAAQKTGFLAQLAAAVAAGQAEAQRLKDFYANEEAQIRSGDQSRFDALSNWAGSTIAGLNATIAQLQAQQSGAATGTTGSTAPPPLPGAPDPRFVLPTTVQGWIDQSGSLFGVIFQWSSGLLVPGTTINQGWKLPVAYNGGHDLVRIQAGAGQENAAARVARWVAEVMQGNPNQDVNAVARSQIVRLGADALDSAGVGNVTQDQAGQILWNYGFDFGPLWNEIVALRQRRGTI